MNINKKLLLSIMFLALLTTSTSYAQVNNSRPISTNQSQQITARLNSFLEAKIQSEKTRYNEIKNNKPMPYAGRVFDDPKFSLYLLNGRQLEKYGKYQEAINAYTKSLQYELWGAENYYGYLDLGRCYYRLGQFDKSKAALNEFIPKAKNNMIPSGGEDVPPETQKNILEEINEAKFLLNLVR